MGLKKFLILEKETYRYQKVLSDIAGNDIKAHNNEPELLIKAVRDWFKIVLLNVARHKEICLALNDFDFDYELLASEKKIDKMNSLYQPVLFEHEQNSLVTL